MASTHQQIQGALAASMTTIYSAFTGSSPTRAEFAFINLCNTTTLDITVDLLFETGGAQRKILDDQTVPAKGVVQWTGLVVLNNASQLIRLSPSASGIDYLGAVVEQ